MSITDSLVASIESELEVLKSLPAIPESAPEAAPVVVEAPAPVVVEAEMTPLRKLVLAQAADRLARETAN